MIDKEKLLGQIDKAIELEKRAVPLINKHVSASLAFSELKADEVDALMDRLRAIAATKARHVEMLEEIKEGILKGRKGVY
jgi:hypothetical protein